MSSKNFKTSFDDILGGGKVIKDSKSSSDTIRDKKQIDTKATFIINRGHHDKMKVIAVLERKMIKDVLHDALSEYIIKYEKDNGEVKIPH